MNDLNNKDTVIVLNDYCHINGGASKMAISEAVSLSNHGMKVIFIGAVSPICDELKDSNIRVISLEQEELADAGANVGIMLQGLWNRKAYGVMKDILHDCDVSSTIVHLHGYTKALTTSPVRCAIKMGFHVVCTLHDFFPACPNGGYFDYQENKPCARKCLSASCIFKQCDKRNYVHKLYRVARSFGQRFLGLFPNKVKHYITLSEKSASILQPYLPIDAKYYPLENLIEAEELSPINVSNNKEIVVVGRLDPEKGIELLLNAAKNIDVNIVFVGDGPLREVAESYDHVRVTGWVDTKAVMDYLRLARCLVFPSLWYETYGLVVSEAISLGVPVIVSDITAAAERIEDGVHGWHFKSGDSNDLARCLGEVMDDYSIKSKGIAAYDMFWDNPPTGESHIRGLLAIYHSIKSNNS